MHLAHQFGHANAANSSYLAVVIRYFDGGIIRFKKQSLRRTGLNTFLIEIPAERNIKPCIEQRAQLLRLSAKAMENPRLSGVHPMSQSHNIIKCLDAMNQKRYA